jgi:hypothetical protein
MRQERPPGDDTAWYVEIGNDPDVVGAAHDTLAEASPATATTSRGADARLGGAGAPGSETLPTTARPPTALTSIGTVPYTPEGITTLLMLVESSRTYEGDATPPM